MLHYYDFFFLVFFFLGVCDFFAYFLLDCGASFFGNGDGVIECFAFAAVGYRYVEGYRGFVSFEREGLLPGYSDLCGWSGAAVYRLYFDIYGCFSCFVCDVVA